MRRSKVIALVALLSLVTGMSPVAAGGGDEVRFKGTLQAYCLTEEVKVDYTLQADVMSLEVDVELTLPDCAPNRNSQDSFSFEQVVGSGAVVSEATSTPTPVPQSTATDQGMISVVTEELRDSGDLEVGCGDKTAVLSYDTEAEQGTPLQVYLHLEASDCGDERNFTYTVRSADLEATPVS